MDQVIALLNPDCLGGGSLLQDLQQRRGFHGLALQLLIWTVSESMRNHDSKIVDAGSVD